MSVSFLPSLWHLTFFLLLSRGRLCTHFLMIQRNVSTEASMSLCPPLEYQRQNTLGLHASCVALLCFFSCERPSVAFCLQFLSFHASCMAQLFLFSRERPPVAFCLLFLCKRAALLAMCYLAGWMALRNGLKYLCVLSTHTHPVPLTAITLAGLMACKKSSIS